MPKSETASVVEQVIKLSYKEVAELIDKALGKPYYNKKRIKASFGYQNPNV